ncbi:unnamed protein product [Diplocarpon coronariae]
MITRPHIRASGRRGQVPGVSGDPDGTGWVPACAVPIYYLGPWGPHTRPGWQPSAGLMWRRVHADLVTSAVVAGAGIVINGHRCTPATSWTSCGGGDGRGMAEVERTGLGWTETETELCRRRFGRQGEPWTPDEQAEDKLDAELDAQPPVASRLMIRETSHPHAAADS